MPVIKEYSVWKELSGDTFKGFKNELVTTSISEKTANEIAAKVSGWVESEETNCHPDYIELLQRREDLYSGKITNTKAL